MNFKRLKTRLSKQRNWNVSYLSEETKVLVYEAKSNSLKSIQWIFLKFLKKKKKSTCELYHSLGNMHIIYESVSHSTVSDSFQPHGPPRLLGPCMESPGKNTGMDSHFLLQGIFPIQGLNLVSWIAGVFFTIWATREGPYIYTYIGINLYSITNDICKYNV